MMEGEYMESMQEVLGEVVYGGRITDEIDRRILKTIMRKFINEEIMNEEYYYTEDYRPLGKYGINTDLILQEIDEFP